MEYKFEERQRFAVKVFNVQHLTHEVRVEALPLIGELEFMLHEVVTSRNQILRKALTLPHKRKTGTIVMRADEESASSSKELCCFSIASHIQ